MARGRMLNCTIATDDRLNSLSISAQRLWFFTLPHIDRDGLIDGRSRVLWAMAAPLQSDLMDVTPQIINEWVDAGMVIRYNGDRTPVLFFPAFQRNQAGMRYDREPPSSFPPPPGFYRTEIGLQRLDERVTDDAGRMPEECRKTSGELPEDFHPEVEVEVKEQDQDQGQGRGAAPPPPPAPPPSVEVALDGEALTAEPDPTTPKAMTQQPAIVTYRAIFQLTPSKAAMLQILEHGIGDIPLWERVMIAWLRKGYNPLNIGGMFDWYDNPALIATPGSQRSATPAGKGQPLSKVEMSMRAFDEIDDMLAKGGTL
jgi:hypothetical protein